MWLKARESDPDWSQQQCWDHREGLPAVSLLNQPDAAFRNIGLPPGGPGEKPEIAPFPSLGLSDNSLIGLRILEEPFHNVYSVQYSETSPCTL